MKAILLVSILALLITSGFQANKVINGDLTVTGNGYVDGCMYCEAIVAFAYVSTPDTTITTTAGAVITPSSLQTKAVYIGRETP